MANEISESIRHAVVERHSLLVDIAQRLIRARSTNPPGDVREVAAVAESFLEEHVPTVLVELHRTTDQIVNLVAVVKGHRPGKRLVLNGHLDTYAVDPKDEWTSPPFEGRLSDDRCRLYGRGSCDMKGGIAASLIAFCVLSSMKSVWSGELVLTLAGDEETMGQLGTKYLLDHVGLARGDAMLCGDAGAPGIVRIAEKGLLWLKIKCTGKAAHGAHVHLGVNALEIMMQALAKVKALEDLPVHCPPEILELMERATGLSEASSGAGESATLKRVTVNIGIVQGGQSPNLVPSSAEASVDIRIPVGLELRVVTEALRKALGGMNGVGYEILQAYEPTFTDPSEEIVQLALAASNEIRSSTTVPNVRVGASDARLYRAHKIPSVVLGLTPHNMGGPDEFVETHEMLQLAQIHALIAYRYLSIQV